MLPSTQSSLQPQARLWFPSTRSPRGSDLPSQPGPRAASVNTAGGRERHQPIDYSAALYLRSQRGEVGEISCRCGQVSLGADTSAYVCTPVREIGSSAAVTPVDL